MCAKVTLFSVEVPYKQDALSFGREELIPSVRYDTPSGSSSFAGVWSIKHQCTRCKSTVLFIVCSSLKYWRPTSHAMIDAALVKRSLQFTSKRLGQFSCTCWQSQQALQCCLSAALSLYHHGTCKQVIAGHLPSRYHWAKARANLRRLVSTPWSVHDRHSFRHQSVIAVSKHLP